MHPFHQTGAIIFALASIASAQSSSGTPSASASSSASSSSSSSGYLPQSSPSWLPSFPSPSGVNSGYPTGALDTSTTLDKTTLNLTDYPEPWSPATTDHPEVKAAYNALDWSKVPNSAPNKADKNGDITFGNYDDSKDPNCWWSSTNCVKPKINYIPEDIYYCPTAGDWGLNYDDGPYNPSDSDALLNNYSEPVLYNFLANNNNQKATLFYIGSNVVTYPAAARRAINDGLIICVHTWSHPAMTTQTNLQVVAEFYWTLRAIKEAVGITPKCWRPPYGDVDDRVRAIAWQMGLSTYLWNKDSNDWNMPGDGGGNLPWDTVDGYFEGWVEARKNGSDNTVGTICLEHELNNATVKMTEKWLPTLQQTFNVKSIHDCMGITQPYWEENWVYPANASGNSTIHANSTASASSVAPSSSSIGGSAAAAGASSGSSAAQSVTSLASNLSVPSIALGLVLMVAGALMS